MSQNVTGPNAEEYVVCPYNNAHLLLPIRLAVHLSRCARNYPSAKLVTCPFKSTHVYSVADMKSHVQSCPNRTTLVHFTNPDKMPQPESCKFLVESTENWDDEPAAPTYNPQAHCENAFIIRNPQGAPPAGRREFREKERKRFIQNKKF